MGSRPGPQHLKTGKPNQDAVAFHDGDSGVMVAALADGAGSLKFSAEGAQAAVEAAVSSAFAVLPYGSLLDMTMRGLEAAREVQCSFKDFKEYGSTLVVATLDVQGDWAVSALGDSFAVIHTNDSRHLLVTGTQIGEYANITELLTSDPIHPVHLTGQGALGFTLCSDGLEQVATTTKPRGGAAREAHAGFWDGIRDRALAGTLAVDALFDWLQSQDRIVDDTTMLTSVRR